ncbi:hypothetical protein U5640_12205 [Streptomyces sp. SS7]|uniref:hypothetical protein n=1 Tax=Streptomyces sp. SS7 TaxID=3108485 RepID=UPI0030EDE006
MVKTAGAVGELTQAVLELARGQGRLITAMSDDAREQRITNLIVRPQITADPVEKARCMDALHRRSPHDSF